MCQGRVLVAVSGGVDSAVAVYLLKQKGFDVTAIMLRMFDKTNDCGEMVTTEIDSARQICDSLDVPLVYPDYRKEFEQDVIRNFAESYVNGLTPNPCVQCNRTVKFRYVFDYADKNGFDFVATGHYASVCYNKETKRYNLIKGRDERKDQSYVLYALTQAQLSRLILPLGELSKASVRELAKEAGFKNADKPDSQDICFISGDYYDFISDYFGKAFAEGNFVDSEGNVLGRHKGIIRYTLGQRKGLGLSFDSPRYVIKKNIADNTVVLGKEDELYSDTVIADNVNLIEVQSISEPVRVQAMIRYNQKAQWATVYPEKYGAVKAVFDTPQRAAAAGQSLVMYQGNRLFGGGTIINK